MQKTIKMTLMSAILTLSLLLNGCENTKNASNVMPAPTPEKNTAPEQTVSYSLPLQSENTRVEQGGPYGKLSLSIPDGWFYETCPMDSDQLQNGLYGIRFYPADVKDGCIELAYIDSFGVCGTGLCEETATIAGNPARIGTYDNHAYWDFITFREDYSGVVALTYNVESWWEDYGKQVMDILDTLSYDTSDKEGCVYIYSPESESDKIGLSFTLEKITPTGATLVFHQYDEKAPTGELEYGDAFVLEVLKNKQWEEVPVAVNGAYGFHQIAYTIPKQDSTEQELDWEWLYGTLEAGHYRIIKEILDFRGSGDFDKYTVSAQFLLN
ncbi:MAG: hypothetical protein K2L86_10605 [Lachnospiraceae bacterium]|nr:hypothetical protein [Lachnospiraceae bacterium]